MDSLLRFSIRFISSSLISAILTSFGMYQRNLSAHKPEQSESKANKPTKMYGEEIAQLDKSINITYRRFDAIDFVAVAVYSLVDPFYISHFECEPGCVRVGMMICESNL